MTVSPPSSPLKDKTPQPPSYDQLDISGSPSELSDDHESPLSPAHKILDQSTITSQVQSQKLHSQTADSPYTTFKAQDFWYPVFTKGATVDVLEVVLRTILMSLMLPVAFLTWAWFQIATFSRLSPGGTPHSADVPKFILQNIYNEQTEVNHIIRLSEQMGQHAESLILENQAHSDPKGKRYTPSQPTTTSTTTAYNLATTSQSKPRKSGCCGCGNKAREKEAALQFQARNNSANAIHQSVTNLDANGYDALSMLKPPKFGDNSDENNFDYFEHLFGSTLPKTQLRVADHYRREHLPLFNNSRRLAIDPVEDENEITANGVVEYVGKGANSGPNSPLIHSLSTSLPFLVPNGQLCPSLNISPNDVLAMWREDELIYTQWCLEIGLAAILFLFVNFVPFSSPNIRSATLTCSVFAISVFVAQFLSRRRQVHKAGSLTIRQSVGALVGFYGVFNLFGLLQTLIGIASLFRFLSILLTGHLVIQALQRPKPRRQLEYQHHIMVVSQFLENEMRKR